VEETASGAVRTVQELVKLFDDDRRRIQQLGRITGSALRVHHALQQRPIDTATRIAQRAGISLPTVNSALEALGTIGIAKELTGKKRGRVFSYERYLQVIGSDPIR
jgi:Fic family protein